MALPPAGSAGAQGRTLAAAPPALGAPLAGAVVVAPLALDARGLGAAGPALHPLAGSDGTHPVVAHAADGTSGVHAVQFRLRNATGAVVAEHAPRFAPWTWAWPADEGAGTYTLEVEVEDVAGHTRSGQREVVLVPTDPAALQRPPSLRPPGLTGTVPP